MNPFSDISHVSHFIQPFFSPEKIQKAKEPTGVKFARAPLEDVREFATNRVLMDVVQLLETDSGWVAGGAFETILRGESPKDIDVFFKGPRELLDFTNKLLANGYRRGANYGSLVPGKTHTIRCVELDTTNRPPVQCIKVAWYDSLEQVLDQFDYTVCQIGIDGARWVVYNPLAMEHLKTKTLSLHRAISPEGLQYRFTRYTAKGYTDDGSIKKAMDAFLAGGGVFSKGPMSFGSALPELNI